MGRVLVPGHPRKESLWEKPHKTGHGGTRLYPNDGKKLKIVRWQSRVALAESKTLSQKLPDQKVLEVWLKP